MLSVRLREPHPDLHPSRFSVVPCVVGDESEVSALLTRGDSADSAEQRRLEGGLENGVCFKDGVGKNGKLFNPEEYATYSTTTSYIDYSVNRQNLPQKGADYDAANPNKAEEGLYMEFPYTPWPVGLTYSYIRGTIYKDFSNLDWTQLKADNKAGRIPKNADWPADDYNGGQDGWYVRLRTNVKFYQPGTYEIVVVVPYSTVK